MEFPEQKLQTVTETAENVARALGMLENSEPGEFVKRLRMELGEFLAYLSASDGTITSAEAQMISECTGEIFTPASLNTLIRENNIYSVEFESKVPEGMDILSEIDNILLDLLEEPQDIAISELYLSVYREAGEALIMADGDADEAELQDYDIYMTMLEHFLDEKLQTNRVSFGDDAFADFGDDAAADFGDVEAPAKSGAKAPPGSGVNIPTESDIKAPEKS